MVNNIFFISDTHFHHNRIIELSRRPFSSCDEMDEVMIENWNSVIKSQDQVYHLGDFAFARTPTVETLLKRLNGHHN